MIRLQHIGRDFQVGSGVVHALRDVSLHIAPGEYVSIMGPSGSGKSTLLNVIGLLDRPDAGAYLFDGVDVTGFSDREQALVRRDKIGFIFQFFHLVPRLTAEENVELPAVLAGLDPAQRRPRVRQLLADCGLADRASHRQDQLSGGERQRVAIARAMVMGPAVLLADEPTGNLDQATGQEVIALLEKLNREGVVLIIVTHDPEVGKRSRRQIRMVDGRIQTDIGAHP
jgi:putative ABC transport system ATP-binding protein